jgi:SP family xylose:H+ symportor-like MFS transporter
MGVAMVLAFMMQVFFQLSGITVIVIYGTKLVEDVIPQWKYEMPLIVNGQKIFAGLFGTVLLNRFGRRFLMLRGIIILLLSLIGLLVCFSLKIGQYSIIEPLIIIFLIIYISTFVMTIGPITWLYIS